MENYKQADGLRGLMTLFVIASHWIPNGRILSPSEAGALSFIELMGSVGMYFFFVLSGFLISGILIRNRIKAETENYPIGKVWKSFFLRRTLRIFPIYYLSLLVLIYFNVSWIRPVSGWHFAYLSNVLFYKENHWGLGGHLWSLSSEEQFYLLWPMLMLFVPLRHLRKVAVISIITAPLFRMIMNYFWPETFTQLLTPAVFDGLGLGALLAIWKNVPGATISDERIGKITTYTGITGLVLVLLFFIKPFGWIIWNEYNPVHELLNRSAMAMCGIFLVWGTVKGFKGILKPVLENKTALFLGKISYALYLYHNYQLYVFEWFKIKLPTSGWYLLVHFAILLIVCTLSWYLLELPLNNLKKYFPYVKKAPLPEPAALSMDIPAQ